MSSKYLYERVRTVLLHEWDPIGIGEITEAQDEYDAYVQPVCDLVSNNKGMTQIHNYLNWVVQNQMCLSMDDAANKRIAEKLAALSLTD